ncbi:hypothetical protein MTP99_005041 [Tenebrio molitor]|nr:hypothetical protein MTP99_005041 [Tenebrio molitor]
MLHLSSNPFTHRSTTPNALSNKTSSSPQWTTSSSCPHRTLTKHDSQRLCKTMVELPTITNKDLARDELPNNLKWYFGLSKCRKGNLGTSFKKSHLDLTVEMMMTRFSYLGKGSSLKKLLY